MSSPNDNSSTNHRLQEAWHRWLRATKDLLIAASPRNPSQVLLFLLGLAIYIASRTLALESFPIYFFTDEAVQTVLAADFVRDGLHGYDGVYLPTFFENASLFNLSISVYLQIIPYKLFGKSIVVTRAVPALITASAALALGLIMKRSFKVRYWWTSPLILGLIPTWFLHSRTAFETTLYVSFTTWALFFYLEYRRDRPRLLLPAMLFAALGFYSYAGGQIVILMIAITLLILDWRYHKQHRRIMVEAILFGIILVYPYLRFRAIHSGEMYYHFRRMDSYWFQDLTPWRKILTFVQQYLQGLNPIYWFRRYPDELQRHLMRGYGRISPLALPFFLIGLFNSIRSWKDPGSRVLIVVTLASPLGGALVSPGITRVLLFVIPAAAFIVLGLSSSLFKLEKSVPSGMIAVTTISILVIAQGGMFIDSVKNGPTWYQDYGMTGMQYGAKEVFQAARDVARQPDVDQVFISPTWANGTDILKRFFIADEEPIYISNAQPFLEALQDDGLDQSIFVLTPYEFEDLRNNPKVDQVDTTRTLSYPNGEPGFYFVQFTYSPEAITIFAQEEAERTAIQVGRVDLNSIPTRVTYPYTDMGELNDVFDEDPYTLLRFYKANPATLTLIFNQETSVRGVSITTGSMDVGLNCILYSESDEVMVEFSQSYRDLPDDPTVELDFGQVYEDVAKMEISISALSAGEPFKIHLRELSIY